MPASRELNQPILHVSLVTPLPGGMNGGWNDHWLAALHTLLVPLRTYDLVTVEKHLGRDRRQILLLIGDSTAPISSKHFQHPAHFIGEASFLPPRDFRKWTSASEWTSVIIASGSKLCTVKTSFCRVWSAVRPGSLSAATGEFHGKYRFCFA